MFMVGDYVHVLSFCHLYFGHMYFSPLKIESAQCLLWSFDDLTKRKSYKNQQRRHVCDSQFFGGPIGSK